MKWWEDEKNQVSVRISLVFVHFSSKLQERLVKREKKCPGFSGICEAGTGVDNLKH